MSYRNKTYVVLDYDTDNQHYNIMKAWKEHKKIEFNFYNAHEVNSIREWSSEDSIKAALRERMNNSKQVIVLVGERTKYNHKYVRWEQEQAIRQELPIIAVNLNGSNGATDLTPPVLKDGAYFVSIPFEMAKIQYALDNFPAEHSSNFRNGPSSRQYNWDKISL
jgi:hypothetical protein